MLKAGRLAFIKWRLFSLGGAHSAAMRNGTEYRPFWETVLFSYRTRLRKNRS